MRADHLYEYAVVRYVPLVEREEFVNIGLIMMCKRQRWIRVQWHLDPVRLAALKGSAPVADIERQLATFADTASGATPEVREWPVEDRFRWLTAEKSACLATSRPHPGTTDNLDHTFARLFSEYVL